MAYSPKVAFSQLTQKDGSKKDIDKLAKKATDAATAQPFFICADHKFPDGKIGHLFLFGKLNKVKADIKGLKDPEHQHGVAYVTTDEKGGLTLNLLPSKGKLTNKDALLKKAFKETFPAAYREYKVGAVITEDDAEKLAAAAELLEDVADEPEVAAKTKAEVTVETKAVANEALKTLQTTYNFLYPNPKNA